MRPDELVALLRHIARLESTICTLEERLNAQAAEIEELHAKEPEIAPEPAP